MDRINVEVKLVVGEDGTTKFSGLLISKKDKDGNQIEEITILKKEDVRATIKTLETIASTLRKAIGIKEEELGLENLINFVMEEPNTNDTNVETFNRNRPIWSCRDISTKCVGCEGCGGLTGDEANLMREGKKIQAIKSYRTRIPLGLRDTKIKVEQWLETLRYYMKKEDGNI